MSLSKLRKFGIISITLVTLGVSSTEGLIQPTEVYAFSRKDGSFDNNLWDEPQDVNDPMSWNQSRQDWSASPKGANPGLGELAIAQNSCMTQCTAFIRVKTGDKPRGYYGWKCRDELIDNGMFTNGYPDFQNPKTFGNLVESVSSASASSADEVKKYWEDGYLVIAFVQAPDGAHVVAVDEVKDGKIIMMDSGYIGTSLEDSYINKGAMSSVMLLKLKDGKKGKDLPSLFENRSGELKFDGSQSNGSAEGKSKGVSKEDIIEESVAPEDKLVGMKTRNYLADHQIDIGKQIQELVNNTADPTGTYLSVKEKANIASIKDDIKGSKKNQIDYIRIGVNVVGIAFFLYGLLLIVAYIMDLGNIFFEVELFKILTFGRREVQKDKNLPKEAGGIKQVSMSGLAKIVLSSWFAGWLLVSGTIYVWIDFLYTLLRGIFKF